jgi:ethanolamine utilization protein EutN
MYLAKVLGTVVASTKCKELQGVKLFWVQPLDETLAPAGKAHVAADAVQAGVGELVTVEDGREGTYALAEHFVPVDAVIVGHVDQVNVVERKAKE